MKKISILFTLALIPISIFEGTIGKEILSNVVSKSNLASGAEGGQLPDLLTLFDGSDGLGVSGFGGGGLENTNTLAAGNGGSGGLLVSIDGSIGIGNSLLAGVTGLLAGVTGAGGLGVSKLFVAGGQASVGLDLYAGSIEGGELPNLLTGISGGGGLETLLLKSGTIGGLEIYAGGEQSGGLPIV